MLLESFIIEILAEKKRISSGHCGVYVVDLIRQTESTFTEVKECLKKLKKDKKIKIREGIHGYLIFSK